MLKKNSSLFCPLLCLLMWGYSQSAYAQVTIHQPCDLAGAVPQSLPLSGTTSGDRILEQLVGIPGKKTYILTAQTLTIPPVGTGDVTLALEIFPIQSTSSSAFIYNSEGTNGSSADEEIVYLNSNSHWVPGTPQIDQDINILATRSTGVGITLQNVTGCNF